MKIKVRGVKSLSGRVSAVLIEPFSPVFLNTQTTGNFIKPKQVNKTGFELITGRRELIVN